MEHIYNGSCHCGAIQFKVQTDLARVTQCDCTLCRKKNAVMTAVHESKFELISGAELLATYAWNTKVAQHHFCSNCGIYTHHRKRKIPDHFGINLHCLEGLNVSALNIETVDGATLNIIN